MMINFRQVCEIDPAPLASALADHGGMFNDLTWRQDHPASPHPDTETIYLRMPAEITLDTVFHGTEEVEYPAWGIGPLRDAAERLAAHVGGKLGRVMVIKLKPGGRIKEHIDQGSYAAATDRYHLPITTNDRAWLRAGDETVSMPAGSVFWFNKHELHDGANDGDTDRVHLVVDVYREVTFQEEPFSEVRADIERLMWAHWEEVAGNKDRVPLDPSWDQFEMLDKAGMLHVLTARHGHEMVGYVVHIVVRSMHYRSLMQAHDDAHYLAPEHRRGWTAVKMFRAAEEMLRRHGVNAVSYHTKNREDIHRGPVFTRLGYKPVETIYFKLL
jgi:GNAT superfamily N-acetyltransferase